jgi:hypothetical protein
MSEARQAHAEGDLGVHGLCQRLESVKPTWATSSRRRCTSTTRLIGFFRPRRVERPPGGAVRPPSPPYGAQLMPGKTETKSVLRT